MCSRTLVEKIEKYVFTLVKTIQNDDQNCCSGDIKLLPCALHYNDGDGDHYEGKKKISNLRPVPRIMMMVIIIMMMKVKKLTPCASHRPRPAAR